ncbi:MAG TPA: glycosyltransferase family 2 protein, partial [Flavisolibacter sp.]|nr:glycosyltransferase family 2 protein [Flavisolibacter sp.]
MLRIPLSPPQILPRPSDAYRPLFSVMIPVYNCSAYLEETIASVLAQDMGEALMQIEVVDDASTDVDVQALVQQIGGGRVQYYRQAENVGSLRNFETCLNRARGIYVHLLHGDDRVR